MDFLLVLRFLPLGSLHLIFAATTHPSTPDDVPYAALGPSPTLGYGAGGCGGERCAGAVFVWGWHVVGFWVLSGRHRSTRHDRKLCCLRLFLA